MKSGSGVGFVEVWMFPERVGNRVHKVVCVFSLKPVYERFYYSLNSDKVYLGERYLGRMEERAIFDKSSIREILEKYFNNAESYGLWCGLERISDIPAAYKLTFVVQDSERARAVENLRRKMLDLEPTNDLFEIVNSCVDNCTFANSRELFK
jgi:hypothetical protein